MRDCEIPAAVMRGTALSHWVYPDPSLRPMSDVDILVPSWAADRVVPGMTRHGLELDEVPTKQFQYRVDGIKVEIHWCLVKRGLHTGTDDWLEDLQPVSVGKHRLTRLSADHELLQLVTHGFMHHEVDTILKAIDIALVARSGEVDWPNVVDWCRRAELLDVLCFTFSIVDHLLELDLSSILAESGIAPRVQPLGSLDPYLVRILGEDRRHAFLLRRLNSVRMAGSRRASLARLRRLARWPEIRRLLSSQFDQRPAICGPPRLASDGGESSIFSAPSRGETGVAQ